ncbi:putative transcription factor MYB family [Helianthus anomalus]
MDGSEGDSRYLSNYGVSQGYGSTRPKISVRNLPRPQSQLVAENYVDEDDDVEEDEEEEAIDGEGDGGMNGSVQRNGDYGDNGDNDYGDGDDSDNNDDDGDGGGEDYKRSDGLNIHRHPKKRKLKSLSSSFELAPRVPLPPPQVGLALPAGKSGGRNTLTDWSERETFILLDAWGERFLQRGRKSLRSEEWQEVAEKVSQGSKLERTDTQCRNRLDTLKKKYKKEKALLEQNKISNTKWVYFKKMNMLMVATPVQQANSRELVLMNPNAYLNRANGLGETRDGPGNANSQDGGEDDDDDDDLDLLPPKKSRYVREKVNGGSFKLLADSINRFSDIYEKIENGKRKQMMELEKMRMDFYKDLELQKQKILDRARDEIAKIRQGDHEENDDSADNIRG